MDTPDMLLSANDTPVTNEDACRDSVMRLELRIPSELITRLRKEILATYHPGKDEAERQKYAYESACPAMVDACKAEWHAKQHAQPLTKLSALVAGAMKQWFTSIDMDASFMPPQIAVRTNDDLVFGAHVDGLPPVEEEEEKDSKLPFAVVGIYLDEVSGKQDGALQYWPTHAATVRQNLATLSGVSLTRALRAVGDTCNAQPAEAVIGPAGHAYFVGGNVPHCNHDRTVEGERVAVYYRLYLQETPS
ncbi:hypothetical protein [Cupriavidus pinatubonensis]|nr:hypothetical protein [Cupriavidus pinatubonensis]